MKKVIYYIVVIIYTIIGFPISLIFFKFKEKYNSLGRQIDYYFGIKSRHTRLWEESHTNK